LGFSLYLSLCRTSHKKKWYQNYIINLLLTWSKTRLNLFLFFILLHSLAYILPACLLLYHISRINDFSYFYHRALCYTLQCRVVGSSFHSSTFFFLTRHTQKRNKKQEWKIFLILRTFFTFPHFIFISHKHTHISILHFVKSFFLCLKIQNINLNEKCDIHFEV
jgi:hypothetical protein